MPGGKNRGEKMFSCVKMDDLIPEDHLLRLVHRYVDLGFIRRVDMQGKAGPHEGIA